MSNFPTVQSLKKKFPEGRNTSDWRVISRKVKDMQNIKKGKTYLLCSNQFGSMNPVICSNDAPDHHKKGEVVYFRYTFRGEGGKSPEMAIWHFSLKESSWEQEIYEIELIPKKKIQISLNSNLL